jgi:hypothetical protein
MTCSYDAATDSACGPGKCEGKPNVDFNSFLNSGGSVAIVGPTVDIPAPGGGTQSTLDKFLNAIGGVLQQVGNRSGGAGTGTGPTPGTVYFPQQTTFTTSPEMTLLLVILVIAIFAMIED